MSRAALALFAVPLLLLAAATALFHSFPWDLEWQSAFYDPAGKSWSAAREQPWKALYDYGYFPAWIVAAGSLVILIAGFFHAPLARFRKIAVFLILVLAIGSGLIVNAIFKDHWGRPRPRDVEPFGGKYAFEEVLTIDPASDGKSFPCGHASTGYYFFSLAFVFAAMARRALAWISALFAMVFGTLLGIARMIQGGHFASDVLWSAGMVFLTAASLYYIMGLHKNPLSPPRPQPRPAP